MGGRVGVTWWSELYKGFRRFVKPLSLKGAQYSGC